MATLAVNKLSVDGGGALLTLVAAAGGGDQFPNEEGTFFVVANGGGAPITVTFDSVRTSDLGTDVNPAETVTDATTRVFGPFAPQRYNNSSGRVAVTYSGVTTVTVGAFRLMPKASLAI